MPSCQIRRIYWVSAYRITHVNITIVSCAAHIADAAHQKPSYRSRIFISGTYNILVSCCAKSRLTPKNPDEMRYVADVFSVFCIFTYVSFVTKNKNYNSLLRIIKGSSVASHLITSGGNTTPVGAQR